MMTLADIAASLRQPPSGAAEAIDIALNASPAVLGRAGLAADALSAQPGHLGSAAPLVSGCKNRPI
jgi:hypothetical protein